MIWAMFCHSSTDSANILFFVKIFSIFRRIDNCCLTAFAISDAAEDSTNCSPEPPSSVARESLLVVISVKEQSCRWWNPLWKKLPIFSCLGLSTVVLFPFVCSYARLSWWVTLRYKGTTRQNMTLLYNLFWMVHLKKKKLTSFGEGLVGSTSSFSLTLTNTIFANTAKIRLRYSGTLLPWPPLKWRFNTTTVIRHDMDTSNIAQVKYAPIKMKQTLIDNLHLICK